MKVRYRAQALADLGGQELHPLGLGGSWLTPTGACQRAYRLGFVDDVRIAEMRADARGVDGHVLREVGQHLVGRGPLAVHDPVRQQLGPAPQRLASPT